MRVQSVNLLSTGKVNAKNQNKNNVYSTNVLSESKLPFVSYKDYNITFGERLNRTPEDFYAQAFNIDNMPDTVRKYLFEDFEERRHMPPAQLQRQAFEYLKLADNVQDIKDMYPDEPLFVHLKEVKDTKPNTGILLLLKWDAQTSQTPIFKDKQNKDLTTYLLKKVYLEGKTIDELNTDFDKDATDEIKRELGVKDKKYFSHSNIYTLGIRYPKLPYYNSFLATRNDKEYIPPVRKSSIPVSEETKEKLSVAMTKWWSGLNQMERAEQIQKMLNGKEMSNSIFTKYQGQIMTIAAAQMGFSEKLSDIFSEKYSDSSFVIDFPTFSEQQREIMLEFWNKDPEFRTKYSQALQDTIAEFEVAYYSDDKSQLEMLLNKALDLKARVLNKAREKQQTKREMQKLTQATQHDAQVSENPRRASEKQLNEVQTVDLNSPNKINKLYRKVQMDSMRFYTDLYKSTFMDFLLKNTTLTVRKVAVALSQPDAQKFLNIDDQEFNEIKKVDTDKYKNLVDYFYLKYPLVAATNEFVLNKLLYELTGNPEVFTFNRQGPVEFIKEHNLEQEVLRHRDRLNSEMKKFARTSTGKELDDFANLEFDTAVILHVNQGFKYHPEYSYEMQTAGMMHDLYHQDPENYKAFLKNYNAAIKYYNNPASSPHAKEVIMEHLVAEYINWLTRKEPNAMFDYMNGVSVSKKHKDLDKNYNIDMSSISSLQLGLQQYLHKNETKFWVPEVEDVFLNFAVKHEYANSEILSSFLSTNIEKYNTPFRKLGAHDKKVAVEISKTFTRVLHDDFEFNEPFLTNANNAAINYTLYTLTHKPGALANNPVEAANFIKRHHQEIKLSAASETVARKYKEYLQTLPEGKVDEFYHSTFLPVLMDIAQNGVEFTHIIMPDKFKQNQRVILDGIKSGDKNLSTLLHIYLNGRKAFIKILDDSTIPDEDKDELREKIVVDFIQKYKHFESRMNSL